MMANPDPRLAFTVERDRADPDAWGAYTVDPAGGVGPLAAPLFGSRGEAEGWARAMGRLVEPMLEAA
jgi:hypothetical protein